MKQAVNIIGKRIKEKREVLGISQKDLADTVGITPSSINQYEAGSKNPSTDILKKIALALSTETDYLLGMKKDEDQVAVAFRDLERLSEKDRRIVLENIKTLSKLSKESK